MSKIIKRFVMSFNAFAEKEIAELTIDYNGKEVFIFSEDFGEESHYYVNSVSMFDEVVNDDIPVCLVDAPEEWGIDWRGLYIEEEKEVSKSEYYKCFLYIRSIIKMETFLDEYRLDYGKDIDKMNELVNFRK